MPSTLTSNVLDLLSEARSAEAALHEIDLLRRALVGPGIFSIQLNVTTAQDPRNEIRLRRFYTSVAGQWPVNGTKRKTHTRWTDTLFVHGRPFVGEGPEALARAFDDYEQMRPLGLNAVINVPLLQGNLCFATFNVFGTRGRWQADEVAAARWLALSAMRWVTPAPGLCYAFDAPLAEALADVVS